MTSVRVYIATTQGPSEVQRISEEDPKVRSVVCLNGTSEALPISPAYDAFVRKPTGVIEQKYGHSVYRVDVSERISDGKSWQLGLFAAHALFSANRLAGKGKNAERAVWITGEVDRDMNVNPVDHVEEKLRQSAPLFGELKAAGIPLTIFVPQTNVGDLGETWENIVPLKTVKEMYRDLNLDEETGSSAGVSGLGVILAVLIGAGLWQSGIFETSKSNVAVVAEKSVENTSFELTATEYRVPGHCPGTFPGRTTYDLVSLDKTDEGHFSTSAWEGLCAVEYGFSNTSKKPVHAWIKVSSIGSEQRFPRMKSLPGMKNRQLAPGERISVTMVLPRWSKHPLTIRVMATTGAKAPQKTEEWLDMEHTITPPSKPRFN